MDMLSVQSKFFESHFFLANGSFLHNIGDAEHISKVTVCQNSESRTEALAVHFCDVLVIAPHDSLMRNSTGLQVSLEQMLNLYEVLRFNALINECDIFQG